ncbi:AMP-binding protein [Salinimonas iocasae]|uniref:Long-chain-fatty-acid--CoA ligase n=1 Tax=Salinimonas iocasae TaxID=2572577 RepID=A0A5B7YDB4_9ALTE|nr:AMP-binding protein [Salinimonas iocasae]QCZ92589.1 long-chain fatty acid--CoA ligase [Salinimonas iocasae]
MSINENYTNLRQFIDDRFASYEGRLAYRCLGQSMLYDELDKHATHLARYFEHEMGLKAGDRIVIQLPNLIQYPVAMYAAVRLGLVVVNTNPLYTPREMLHQFTDSGAKAIVILSDLLPKLEQVREQTQIEHVLVTEAADFIQPSSPGHNYHNFIDALNKGETLGDFTPSQAQRDDTAVLQYTGGTTGVSKGAVLSHGNLLANAGQMAARLEARCQQSEGVFVCPLPLYHIYAFTVNMIGLFGMGEANLLIPNPRDMDSFVNAIKAVPFKGLAGINTLFVGLCQHPGFKEIDFSNLKITLSGGAALTHSAAHLWEDVTGCAITEGYGLSETSPVVSFNVFGEEELGTVGKPLEQTQVAAWDEHNQPVPEGEVGELVVKGPQVMKGYWQREDETSKVMIDGWFKTGDMGLIQSNGNVKIVDRLKDMIIVSGFNVFPNEVEDVLSEHPAVMEAAVVGEADEKTGEAVKAFVTVNESVTQDELREYCREHLTNYKVPKHIEVLEELPKSTVGKILRRELRKR